MQIHNNTLITECSAYDFKEMLERKKVKSWLKSVRMGHVPHMYELAMKV